MSKKCFIIIILLCILGSSGLWADHVYGYTLGIPTAVLGCGVVAANLYLLDTPNAYLYGLGALLAAGGFAWLLYDLLTHPEPDLAPASDPVPVPAPDLAPVPDPDPDPYEDDTANYSSQRKMNPIVKHLSFGVMPNQVYIGARFKF